MRFAPDHFEKRGKTFVQPDVAPVFAGHQVAEPLMRELVGNQRIFIARKFGNELRILQRAAGIGRRAGIFHSSRDEIIDHALSVFFPRIIHAKFLAEDLHHRWRPLVIGQQAVAASLRRVIRHGNPALMSLPLATVIHEAGTVRIVSVVRRSFG